MRSNFVATLDGSVQGLDGRSGSINTESDHEVFALHRGLADVILVGAGTVRDEGYRAVDLEPWQTSLRAAEGLAPFPTLVVITGSLRLDPAFADPPYEHGPVLVVTSAVHETWPYGRSATGERRCSGPPVSRSSCPGCWASWRRWT